MPVCVALTVQKRTVRDATACHDGDLVSTACHRAPLATQPPATRAWKGPRATRWWMCWSVGTEWSPAAAVVLSRLGACRSPGLAGTYGASRQVPRDALVGLPGKLLLPGPCLLGLDTLFLNGSKGTTEDLGRHPASPAAGCCNCPCTSSGY